MGIENQTQVDHGNARVVLAIDASGSTKGYAEYWNRVNEIYQQISSTVKNPIYVIWGSKATVSSFADVEKEIRELCYTNSGTDPSKVAALLVREKLEGCVLHLITDGQVYANDVEKADRELGDFKIGYLYAYLLKTGSDINLSVTAPFTRSCKFEIFVDDERLAQGDSSVKVDLSDYNTPAKFLAGFEDLKSTIAVQNMGKNNLTLRNDLLNLQKDLLALAVKEAEGSNPKDEKDPLMSALKSNDYQLAVHEVKPLIDSYYFGETSGITVEISQKIQHLINACTSVGNFSFDLLKTSRAQRATGVTEVRAEEVESLDVSSQNFECPIYYEPDTPALLLAALDQPILAGKPKEVIDTITNCPLFLFFYPDLVEEVVRAIDHPIGMASIKLNAGHFEKSPMTRRDIGGAIPMGATEEHCKAANWSIARMFTGGKLLGNVDLWFAVIWQIAKEKISYLQDNSGFIAAMEAQLLFRMEFHRTFIGLSGLPEYPMIKVPLGAAVWYCVVSGEIYGNDSALMSRDRLRAFAGISWLLIKLLDLVDYPYNREFTENRLRILKAWSYIMNRKQELSQIGDHLRSQYQNHIYFPDSQEFVFLDGSIQHKDPNDPPTPPLPVELAGISLQDCLALYKLADPSKKASAVMIPFDLTPVDTTAKINYGYDIENKKKPSPVFICPLTMRPWAIDPLQHQEWLVCAESAYGPLAKQISGARYYLMYIETHKKLPTREEYIIFAAKREAGKLNNPRDTVPKNIGSIYEKFKSGYEVAAGLLGKVLGKTVGVEDILEKSRAAASLEVRKEIEKGYSFNAEEFKAIMNPV